MELKNLEQIPSNRRFIIQKYLQGFLSLHKENIISIFAYGETVQDSSNFKKLGINLCIIFRKLEFRDIKDSLLQVKVGLKKGIPAPLFLTLEHIKSSQDVFPVEFLDMQDNHILFYGEDLLNTIQIDKEHLRLEIEEQLKGKLIHIRQAYLEMGLEKKGIDILLKGSFNALVPVFRGLLKLIEFGKTPPKEKTQILQSICEKFNLDKEVFFSILKSQQNEHYLLGEEAEKYLARYIEEIQKLIQIVDSIR